MVLDQIRNTVTKIFGSRNERLVKAYRKRVEQVNALATRIEALTDAELRAKTDQFKQQIADGANPREILPEALAVMRESMDRNVGMRQIFNPNLPTKFKPFDPDQLDASTRAVYDQLRSQIDQTAPAIVPGCQGPVEGWLQIDIPNTIYQAIRQLYPQSRPPFRARPFDVQLIGAMVLYEGRIAEMKTGEGKTFVGPLACYMAVCEGMQCHVVTVNDYLVQRDRDWVFPAFYRLGVNVGAIHPFHMQEDERKKEAYQCDVVYGTNSEFGFDYLRDNMKLSVEEQVQRQRDFCIVDEVDSILIDEARTPLIISGPAHDEAPQYQKADDVARQLVMLQRQANQATARKLNDENYIANQAKRMRLGEGEIRRVVNKFKDLGPDFLLEKEAEIIEHLQYYEVKREDKSAHMQPAGVERAQEIVGTRFYVVGNDMGWDHLINNALRAHTVYEINRDYVVEEGEVIIVDEFTGRKMIGRQWSDGLHQAIEAKEAEHGVQIKKETQTLATVTIQNFFKLYKRLAGMTGTAMTEVNEFHEIYHLDAVAIPTNVPVQRLDHEDLIFLTEKGKWIAIVEEIKQYAEQGQPVLVGTTSVEKSEVLSHMLTQRYHIEHEVLNAKQHEREADIVAKAGQTHQNQLGKTVGNVTIATNMAGRGTDIMLGTGVREAGGLHIIGTERHESRRIDNQLRGRAGRQGDPGSSRFFISMEDDLMKMFAGKATIKALNLLGMQEDEAIEHRWISRSVERAQRKVEERNFQIRKNLLEYDEVREHQRSTFYGLRQQVLEGRQVDAIVLDYIADAISDAVALYLDRNFTANQLAEVVRTSIGANIDARRLRVDSLEAAAKRIRADAKSEICQDIETSLGEYMADDLPPDNWDLKGLSRWAMTRFNVDLKQNKLRQMNVHQVTQLLQEAAFELLDRKPMDHLAKFFDKDYAAGELVDRMKQKFDIDLSVEDLALDTKERDDERRQRVTQVIYDKVCQAYDEREIIYPVEHIMELAFSIVEQNPEGGQWAARQIMGFAKQRYDLDFTEQQFESLNGQEIYEQLVAAAGQWHGQHLEQVIQDQINNAQSDPEKLIQWFNQRFEAQLTVEQLQLDDLKHSLLQHARAVLRRELTELEQYALLQILDQSWKDHLYAMDQLRDSIGLVGYAERDPKVMYKMEGSTLFNEMMQSVRDKVTDLILKAKLTPQVQLRNVFAQQEAHFDWDGNTGVEGDNLAQTAERARADREAAKHAGQDEQPAVKQIVNTQPKVGRNDPCPCGSGKKYKKCCGK